MYIFFRYLFFIFICTSLLACSTADNNSQNNKEAANYNAQLGLAYLNQGDIKLAKSKLLLALQQAPNDPLVLDSMAYFLETTGELQKAEQYYLSAIKYGSQDGAAQNNYGTFLCRHGYYQESLQHFLLATQDINYLNTAQAYENAGLCALKIPDKKLAKEYLQKSLAADPNRKSAQKVLAKL